MNHILPRRAWLAPFLAVVLAWSAPALAGLKVEVAGDSAHLDIDLAGVVADVRLDFDAVHNLSAANLGVSARLIDPLDLDLLLRLPSGLLTAIPFELPLLITVEPPADTGFSLNNTVHVDLHTHLLPYTAGSRLRLFKAPLGGDFVDITTDVRPGSVRTDGDTEGFSQFLLVLDLRPTSLVIEQKLSALRDRVSAVPAPFQATLTADLERIEAALDRDDFADALAAIDLFRAAVSANAAAIGNTWTPMARDGNHAGALLAGAASLRFSIGYLRDYGE